MNRLSIVLVIGVSSLLGCATIPKIKTEREIVYDSFKKDKYILAAFEKEGVAFFTIAKYFNEYSLMVKETSLEGFFGYLRSILTDISPWALDALFTNIKLNYELIKHYEKNP